MMNVRMKVDLIITASILIQNNHMPKLVNKKRISKHYRGNVNEVIHVNRHMKGARESLLKALEPLDEDQTSSICLKKFHKMLRRVDRKTVCKLRQKACERLKICKSCDRWNKLSSILTCDICEDHYHQHCLETTATYIQGKYICNDCLNLKPIPKLCKVCHQKLTKTNQCFCKCCEDECHLECLLKNQLCKRCINVKNQLAIRSKRIKKKRKMDGLKHTKECNHNLREMFLLIGSKIDVIVPNSQTRLERNGCAFKAFTQLDGNNQLIDKYKDQLLNAIKSKKMNYTQDLRSIEFLLENLEQTSMNFGLENMSIAEEKEYLKYKNQPIGPYKMVFSQEKGYDVVADRPVPKGSIICEYVGEVVNLRECARLDLTNRNDSTMDLWQGRNSDEKLVIRPEKWTNLGRFLNGVKTKRCETNVISMRVCYRGMPLILLVARRDIMRGESLCYDYNAGGIHAKYDTSKFV